MVYLVVADERADGRRTDHDLHGHGPSPADTWDQRLRNHGLQYEGEGHADLLLLVIGKHVDDAVDRFRTGVGVQLGKCQVTRLGDRQGRGDGFEVAHLADEYHIRVLPECILECAGERRRVGMHLALVDQAVLVPRQGFDRIFHRQDVVMPFPIDLVHDGRQRGGLAGAGGSGHQHESARQFAETLDRCGQAQLLEGLDLERDLPDGGRYVAALGENVGPEAREILHAKGEVELAFLFEAFALLLVHDRVGQFFGLLRVERIQRQRFELAVHTQPRGRSDGDVEVGRVAFRHLFEQIAQVHLGLLWARASLMDIGQTGRILRRSVPCICFEDGRLQMARQGSRLAPTRWSWR